MVDVASAKAAAAALTKKGCRKVVLTLGESGAVFGPDENGGFVHVRTDRVEALDSTVSRSKPSTRRVTKTKWDVTFGESYICFSSQGAGDAFLGALGFFWAKCPHLPMEMIVSKSCEVATLSVMKAGTQASFPCLKDLPVGFIPDA